MFFSPSVDADVDGVNMSNDIDAVNIDL